MLIDKVINNGITIISQGVQKQGQKATHTATDTINSTQMSGLDALASYNSMVVEKQAPKWMLNSEQLQCAKEKAQAIGCDNLTDDKIISYAISKIYREDVSAEKFYTDFLVSTYKILEEMNPKQRERMFNSDFLENVLDASQSMAFRYSCLDCPMDNLNLDELDKLVENKYVQLFLTKLVETMDRSTLFHLIPEFEKRAKMIESFSQEKHASKINDLLSQRNYQNIAESIEILKPKFQGLSEKEADKLYKFITKINNLLSSRNNKDALKLSDILQSRLQGVSEKERNELYPIIEKLLSAKTPKGEFIFGFSESSDKTKKMFLDGIENILELKKSNSDEYQKLMNLLELTKQGKVPPFVLGILPKEGKINKEFLSFVSKTQEGVSSISKFENQTEALSESTLGDVVEIGQDLFYRSDSGLDKLNLSKEAFEELFPPVETFALSQGELGDCYLVGAIFDFIKNPKARGKLYQMFSSNGDDVVVTIPDAKEFPITFTKKILQKDGEKNINASLGIQMLEDAYRQTRALKYGIANKMIILDGGEQADVYSAFLNKKDVSRYEILNKNYRIPTKYEARKELKNIKKELAKLRKEYEKYAAMDDDQKLLYLMHNPDSQDQQGFEEKIDFLETSIRCQLEFIDSLDNYHAVSEEELLEKLIEFTQNENYLVSAATKQGRIFDKNRLICGNHAYSVLGVDTTNKTVKVVNSWNTAQYTVLSFDEFKKYFDMLQVAEI